jgi:hypothetical protein
MKYSQSLLPPASHPAITAFAEGVHARLPQHRVLPSEFIQGLERLRQLVQVLRTGSALVGEEVFAAQELGFDPTRESWALTFLLREPAP